MHSHIRKPICASQQLRIAIAPACDITSAEMRASIPPGGSRNRRWPLLAWGWGILLVVLLSATPTGGAPRTMPIGSAFDPASMAVTLGPSRSSVRTASQTAPRTGDGAANTVRWLHALHSWPGLAALTVPLPGLQQKVWLADTGRHSRAKTAVGPHAARAPPAA